VTERTSRLAVKAVEEASLRADWFFREQPITDQGIDAHIEKFELVKGKRGDHEVGTGRLIALQIKGGQSYFSRPSANGWWFSFKARKAKLWLGHALPVLVVLVDLDSGELYWQRVSAATVIKTGKNYKIEVPRSQTVATASAEWLEIASGLEQHAISRFKYSLLSVPPSVRTLLEGRGEGERADAALLAMHLSEGRTNPQGTVRSLLATSPVWITRNADWAWRAIAAYASGHEVTKEAAEALIRAAAATADEGRRSRDLVSAALVLRQGEPQAALATLAEVDSLTDPDMVHVAIAKTIFSRELSDAAPWALDPLLARDIPEVTESVAAQRLLAMQARRSDDLDAAVEHGRQALRLDETSDESRKQLAEYLLTRWSLFESSASDLHDATSLLRDVIDQRRTWSGPTSEPIEQLARAYGSLGQFEAVLKLTLPPPHGAAEPMELDRAIGRMAAYAARSLGRHDAVVAACDLLGQEPADQLIRADVGVLELDDAEVADLRLKAFEKSLGQREHDEVALHAVALASEGVDVRDRLEDLVERSIIPDRVVALATALLAAHDDLDGALPALRELAKTDPAAAEHLIGLLREAGRHQEAADVAGSLYEITGSEAYLIYQADCLIDAGGGSAAVKAAEAAIAHTTIRPVERGRLLTFLGVTAADQEDWATAERYLAQVLELFDKPTDSAVWRLVIALTNQGRIKKAAKVVAEYRPVVRSRDEAEAWLRAHATLRWNERIAMDAYALAERFDDDPQLSTALLAHIVLSTHGMGDDETESVTTEQSDIDELDELDDAELEERRALAQNSVPGELHRRAFTLMERLVEKHGDRTGITVLKGADTDDLVAQMVETLKNASQVDAALADLVELVRASRAPLGFLAGVIHRGYATLVIQRAMGGLVAGSPDDAEHEIETAAAREHFNREVVVDASAVVTLTGLSDPNRLTGRYLSVVTAPAAMLGLHRSAFDIRGLAGSPGSMRWDLERDGIAITELSDEEFKRLYDRSERVQSYTDRVQVRAVTDRTVLTELANEREHAEWVDVLHLALERRLPVWSDDLGLRRIAREVGLVAFGTPAVVDAIRDLAIENSTGTDFDEVIAVAFDTQIELAADMVVDLPLGTEGLLRLAEADGWKARAGAFALSRPAWWAANPDGIAALRRIYSEAHDKAPDDLPAWQYAAIYGTARVLQPEAASALLAFLAMIGYGEDEPTDETRLDGLRRARQAAADLGYPDPAGAVPAVAAMLAKAGKCADPEQLATRILEALDGSG
jgi:tetratricopeptide (TPR) repeat protein